MLCENIICNPLEPITVLRFNDTHCTARKLVCLYANVHRRIAISALRSLPQQERYLFFYSPQSQFESCLLKTESICRNLALIHFTLVWWPKRENNRKKTGIPLPSHPRYPRNKNLQKCLSHPLAMPETSKSPRTRLQISKQSCFIGQTQRCVFIEQVNQRYRFTFIGWSRPSIFLFVFLNFHLIFSFIPFILAEPKVMFKHSNMKFCERFKTWDENKIMFTSEVMFTSVMLAHKFPTPLT